MQLRAIQLVKNLKNKTVLLRVDVNVSLGANMKVDPYEAHRLEAMLPTLEHLLKKGAHVILLAHLGRPEGKVVEKLRLEPIAKKLQQILHKKFQETRNKKQTNLKFQIQNSQLSNLLPAYTLIPHRVWLLENLRFDPREEKNDAQFAKELASLGDFYVNDAFANAHRKHTSVHAITRYLPSYAGFLLQEEVQHLSSIWHHPRRPLVVVIGGAKISTKIGLIQKFLPHADHILLGGALANTLLKVQGYQIGASLIEPHMERTLRKLKLTDTRLHIPVDVLVARGPKANPRVTAAANVRKHEMILDIGSDTQKLYSALIARARMVVWNGPMGLIEVKKFAQGTYALTEAIQKNKKAQSIIGGGETVTAFRRYVEISKYRNIDTSRIFLSTGGGAMLEFLEKGILPALQPLLL